MPLSLLSYLPIIVAVSRAWQLMQLHWLFLSDIYFPRNALSIDYCWLICHVLEYDAQNDLCNHFSSWFHKILFLRYYDLFECTNIQSNQRGTLCLRHKKLGSSRTVETWDKTLDMTIDICWTWRGYIGMKVLPICRQRPSRPLSSEGSLLLGKDSSWTDYSLPNCRQNFLRRESDFYENGESGKLGLSENHQSTWNSFLSSEIRENSRKRQNQPIEIRSYPIIRNNGLPISNSCLQISAHARDFLLFPEWGLGRVRQNSVLVDTLSTEKAVSLRRNWVFYTDRARNLRQNDEFHWGFSNLSIQYYLYSNELHLMLWANLLEITVQLIKFTLSIDEWTQFRFWD